MAIAILGAGGHAKVVIDSVLAGGEKVAGLYDDRREMWGRTVLGQSIVGPASALEVDASEVVVAIGDNARRQSVVRELGRGRSFVVVVHPTAYVSPHAQLGPGAVVCARAVVQPDAVVGAHAIVNTGSIIEHDCRVGDYAHVAPGARLAGEVRVGPGALVGMGASVLPGVHIGDWATVGAGATCLRDVPRGRTVVGTPARVLPPSEPPALGAPLRRGLS